MIVNLMLMACTFLLAVVVGVIVCTILYDLLLSRYAQGPEGYWYLKPLEELMGAVGVFALFLMVLSVI